MYLLFDKKWENVVMTWNSIDSALFTVYTYLIYSSKDRLLCVLSFDTKYIAGIVMAMISAAKGGHLKTNNRVLSA